MEICAFKTYTGTKTVKAMPMDARRAKDAGANVPDKYFEVGNANYNPGAEGYLVVYPDGYRSWSPKKAFEDAYSVSETHIDRMRIELAKLNEKIQKATKAIYTPDCLENCQREYLRVQLKSMREYAETLYLRISDALETSNPIGHEKPNC